MKIAPISSLAVVSLFFVSCASPTLPLTDLSESERGLLAAINSYRSIQGKEALAPSVSLTTIAREDALRRVTKDKSYEDHRSKTGYEQMLTLAGSAKPGPNFGTKLMGFWKNNPTQKEWMEGNYSGAGVGTAVSEGGMQTGVLLLGGYGEGGF